ncbi:MAG: DNA/RNA nuclease SfsA [Rhodospirillaceae bacterium]|nr:DNA/RNA nuclease SfsA [Rhodospirillaceae bacterium]MBL6930667.1 DNA/RNA nuclease SfsA [Rhodospirillales bacterium]
MKFPDPLIAGRLVKRYKRFLADVELEDGTIVTAHCANSGSMLSVKEPGSEVWLSPARNPERKLRYTWELIKIGKTFVGINTALPNAIVEEAIKRDKIPELAGYASLRREVKYGNNSRIDLLLEDPARPICYVEVKNVTLRRGLNKGDPVEFPDSVTTRGAKHLVELADMVKQGQRSVMMYLVQRQDGDTFTIAGDIDPDYKAGLETAIAAGVEVLCYQCTLNTKGIEISKPLKLAL